MFVEVKTRRTSYFGDPASAVTLEKQRLITRGAMAWLRMLERTDILFRFDIVEVIVEETGTSINVIRNAFNLPEPYIP